MPFGKLRVWWKLKKRDTHLRIASYALTKYIETNKGLDDVEPHIRRWHVVESDDDVTLKKAEAVIKRKVDNL